MNKMAHVSLLTINLSGYGDSSDTNDSCGEESSQNAPSMASRIPHKIAQMEDAKESIVDTDQEFNLKFSSIDTVHSETASLSASSEECLWGEELPSECHTGCHCQACCRCRHLSGQDYDKTCSRDVKAEQIDLTNDWHISSPKYTCLGNCYSPSPNNKIKCRRKDVFEDFDDSPSDVTRGGNNLKSSNQNLEKLHLAYTSLTDKGDNDPPLKSDAPEVCAAGQYPEGISPAAFRQKLEAMRMWFKEFNDEQRNIALINLLEHCDLPQMHLLSVKMESNLHQGCPPNCQDIITWLPSNLTTHIMAMLDPVSLCRASMVCRQWKQIAEDPVFWQIFCCQSKWRMSEPAERKQVKRHVSREDCVQWKKVFAERFRLRNNWLRGRCTVRTFEGHSQGISCVQFDDSRIVSGSSDKTIKVWNIRTNAPWSVQTLVGHSGTVRCLHLDGNRLVSGSSDRTIKVWDLSSRESWSSIACKVTMIGHTDTVRCLQVDEDKVISGSYDKTLKVWDIRTGQCRRTLRGHQEAVLCVHFSDTKIVSGSCDKTIKVWSFDGACVRTLEGHHDAVTCLQFDSTRIVSGSLDCNLKIWDMLSGKCVNTIDWKAAEGHTGVVRYLQADGWRLVSAADDKTIKVWNLETGQRLVTLRNHTDGVTCLQFNDYFIVSGSYDKTVKLWDFSSC